MNSIWGSFKLNIWWQWKLKDRLSSVSWMRLVVSVLDQTRQLDIPARIRLNWRRPLYTKTELTYIYYKQDNTVGRLAFWHDLNSLPLPVDVSICFGIFSQCGPSQQKDQMVQNHKTKERLNPIGWYSIDYLSISTLPAPLHWTPARQN